MFLWCTSARLRHTQKEHRKCFPSLECRGLSFHSQNINNCLWLHCFAVYSGRIKQTRDRAYFCSKRPSTYNIHMYTIYICSHTIVKLLSVVAFLLKSDLHLATMCRSNSRCSNIEHILSFNCFSGTFITNTHSNWFDFCFSSYRSQTLREPDQWFRRSLRITSENKNYFSARFETLNGT